MKNNPSDCALLVIDMQNDFCDGGILAVPKASSLIPRLNSVIRFCETHGILSVFTRDWHPPDHQSFTKNGGVWPEHCVQETRGAELVAGLHVPKKGLIVDKGNIATSDGYSAFQDTPLAIALRSARIAKLAVCGVATEYCVSATVKDALALSFAVTVLQDLIMPIEKSVGNGASAIQEMCQRGAKVESSCRWMACYTLDSLTNTAIGLRRVQDIALWKSSKSTSTAFLHPGASMPDLI